MASIPSTMNAWMLTSLAPVAAPAGACVPSYYPSVLPWIPLLLAACGDAPDAPPAELPPAIERSTPAHHALRASIALRGVPPEPGELDAVTADPSVLPTLVDAWLDDPRFGDTIKDLYAEVLRVRADTLPVLPPLGELADSNDAAMFAAVSEAPLNLVEEVVMAERPLTDLLTDEHVYGNELLQRIYGLEGFDPAGPDVQPMRWTDGRESSGLLSSSALWLRHESNGSNFHRGRANHVSRMFLCDDIGNRDVVVPDGLDLSDDDLVADLVQSEPACAGCHDDLDPLAAHFAGFKRNLRRAGIFVSYNQYDCGVNPAGLDIGDWCYPLQVFDAEWVQADLDNLQDAAYAGQSTDGLADLGRRIAEDPRFAECQSRRFVSFLLQKELRDVPTAAVMPHTVAFEEAGYSAKALARSIVLSDEFAAVAVLDPERAPLAAGLLTLRPEQYARWLEELTGFTWWALGGCSADAGCWPVVDLSRSDLYGFRAMAGGTDGYSATRPSHTATPTRVLVLNRLAAEAAGHVVTEELDEAPADRHLLSTYDGSGESVDRQLEALWFRTHAAPLAPEDQLALRALYDSVVARTGDDAEAWKVVLTALFQDPGLVFY
jgi:hypothetical protein